jgi:hypothetical protein
MAKTFLRRSKCPKSTLRRIEIILRRGWYKRRRQSKDWRQV